MRIFSTKRTYKLTAIVSVIFLSACGSKEEATNEEPVVRPIELLTLEKASGLKKRQFPATIAARSSHQLSFSVGGLISDISVKEAQPIAAGAVIARLENKEFENQLNSAKAQFDNAEEEYQRALRLAKEDAISKSVVDQRKSQRDVANSQLISVQKSLNDATLTSPISGVITSVSADPSQNINPGEPVATVVSIGEMQVLMNLPAGMMARTKNQANKHTHVILDAAPSLRIPATFAEATLEADPVTQTFGVTFDFETPDDLLILPGMSASVELSYSSLEEDGKNVSVPLDAILSEGDATFVWVVDPTAMTVSKRRVQLEDSIGDHVTVSEGLSTGETIAAAGVSYLSEGMEVRPWKAQ